MAEPFIGQIILVGFNFAPRGYALCNGQILSIAQNTALFSLLGTTYGGNGQTTFALPNLQSRVPIHQGQGTGLSPRFLGEIGGVENQTLTISQMPAHNHTVTMPPFSLHGKTTPANTRSPQNAVPAMEASGVTATYNNDPSPANAALAPGAITMDGAPAVGITGSSQPVSTLQPYLTLNYCIALEGIFPSRN